MIHKQIEAKTETEVHPQIYLSHKNIWDIQVDIEKGTMPDRHHKTDKKAERYTDRPSNTNI